MLDNCEEDVLDLDVVVVVMVIQAIQSVHYSGPVCLKNVILFHINVVKKL